MKVGVIGTGYVGKAVIAAFSGSNTIVSWDLNDRDEYPSAALAACDCAIVCVSTPPSSNGYPDIAQVEGAVRSLPCPRIFIKSTVPPGTTERLARETGKSIIFWPEYIGESQYYNPFFPNKIEETPFIIVGGELADRTWAVDFLLREFGPTKRYHQCGATEAELIKYAENAYIATKVTFVNEFRKICERFGADWHTVREGWLLDPRIEPMHTGAFADEPGFAGKCLPKDVLGITIASEMAGYSPQLLRAVILCNENFHVDRAHTSVQA